MNLQRPRVDYLIGEQIQPCKLSKSEIEEYASKIASEHKYDFGKVLELVAALGGRIHYQHLHEWAVKTGSLYVHGPNDFDIMLPHYSSPKRDHFSVAHELGHYFLHSNTGETPLIAFRVDSSRSDWEANCFAAGLLMPADVFREEVSKTDSIYQVATKFGVSTEIATIRKGGVCA